MLLIIKDPSRLRKHLSGLVSANKSVGFVPTMGALHAGHLTLVDRCREQSDICVCSIFINPTQFNDPGDFLKYPKILEKDVESLEARGVDILFIPEVEGLYTGGLENLETYPLGELEQVFEGRYRPGHFQGVCQVMSRLLDIVQPDHLFMGQKDYQQCMVVRELLNIKKIPVEFHAVPTVREENGLAMSSRNLRLSMDDRQKAGLIYSSLQQIGEVAGSPEVMETIARQQKALENAGFRVDYLAIADAESLQVPSHTDPGPWVVLAAAYLGDVRLIDNILVNSRKDDHGHISPGYSA